MQDRKAYIILVNHKGWVDTIECLESILKLTHESVQTIIVDNSPTKESINQLKYWAKGKNGIKVSTSFPLIVHPPEPKPISLTCTSQEESEKQFYDQDVIVIRSNNNSGFSAANNIGLRYALRRNDFDYCWILNNDTVVEKNSLSNQINEIENSKQNRIGILGSKLLFYHKPEEIQAIGGSFNTFSYTTKHIGTGDSVGLKKQQCLKIDYVVGASMLVSKEFLKDVGLMNEDFFLFYEELDWAFRAKKKGWNLDWCETSLVYHKEGASIGSSSSPRVKSMFSDYTSFKSRKVFFKLWPKKRIAFWVSSILIITNRLKRRQFKTAYSFIKILIRDSK